MKTILSLIATSALLANLSAQSVILEDNFNDNSLNAGIWETFLPFASSSVTESDGKVRLTSRGILATKAGMGSAYTVEGSFSMDSSIEQFKFAARTDGSTTTQFSEVTGIIVAFANDDDVISIQKIIPDGTVTFLDQQPYALTENQIYNFSIVVTSSSVSVSINETEVAFASTSYSTGQRVAFLNREIASPSTDIFEVAITLSELFDDFNDNSINTSKWETELPWPNSSVSESGGSIVSFQRGKIRSRASFVAPYIVQGRFKLTGSQYADMNFNIRSSGVLSTTPSLPDNGIAFLVRAENGLLALFTEDDIGDDTIDSTLVQVDLDTWYTFQIADYGNRVDVYWNGATSPTLSIETNYAPGNKISFYSRERNFSGSTLHMDELSITGDRDSDGLFDIHETNTGVYISPVDTGSNPDDANSDGDRWSDHFELQWISRGFDPNVSDQAFSEQLLGHLQLTNTIIVRTDQNTFQLRTGVLKSMDLSSWQGLDLQQSDVSIDSGDVVIDLGTLDADQEFYILTTE